MELEILNRIKIFSLFLWIVFVFSFIGKFIGGNSLMLIFFVFGILIDLFCYYYFDEILLKICRAKPLPYNKFPEIHQFVKEISNKAKIKKPSLYIIQTHHPNSFSLARNTNDSKIIFTYGILKNLNLREIKGVIAHEISHIKNGDALIQGVFALIISFFVYVAKFFKYILTFGAKDEIKGGEIIYSIIILMMAPFLYLFKILAISKNREYIADRMAQELLNDPIGIANALEKIDFLIKRYRIEINPGVSCLFILDPILKDDFISNIFKTHPPVEVRIRKLKGFLYVI
jgi:heat shock protein HtpX